MKARANITPLGAEHMICEDISTLWAQPLHFDGTIFISYSVYLKGKQDMTSA